MRRLLIHHSPKYGCDVVVAVFVGVHDDSPLFVSGSVGVRKRIPSTPPGFLHSRISKAV